MIYMIFFVLHNPDLSEEVYSAWEQSGIRGATILPSVGLDRLRQRAGLREDFPLMPGLADLFSRDEIRNQTLVTVVEGEELVDKVVEATQKVVGDLNLPNTGILAVLPVARAYGLERIDP
jgi:hypothetical protein